MATELTEVEFGGQAVEVPKGGYYDRYRSNPNLDEVATVRQSQSAELTSWLDTVTPEQLATRAPVPDDDVWPPYARGRTVRQCLGTVLNEQLEHHRFTTRDLDLISGRANQDV